MSQVDPKRIFMATLHQADFSEKMQLFVGGPTTTAFERGRQTSVLTR
jgi:hypothetical protein